MKDCNWRVVMAQEIHASEDNYTWTPTDVPPNKSVIGSIQVYKVKLNVDVIVEHYKSHDVAKSYTKQESLHFSRDHCSCCQTCHRLLFVTAIRGWHLHQLDLNNAFSHENLDKHVCKSITPDFSKKRETRVFRLIKSIYGLNKSLKISLKVFHYHACSRYSHQTTNHFLFLKTIIESQTFVLVQVDLLTIKSNDFTSIDALKSFLNNPFSRTLIH